MVGVYKYPKYPDTSMAGPLYFEDPNPAGSFTLPGRRVQ